MSMRRTYPFHLLTAVLFSLITLLLGGAIGGAAYVQQRKLLLTAVTDIFARSFSESRSELVAACMPVQAQLALLATAIQEASPADASWRQISLTARLLEGSPGITSIRLLDTRTARELTLTPLRDANVRRSAGAPPRAAYRLDEARPTGRGARYLDAGLTPLGETRAMPTPVGADGAPEIRIHHATSDGALAIGADVGLKNLSATLSRQRATPSMQLALLDTSGRLLAASHGAWPDAPGSTPAATLAGMHLPVLAALVEQPIRGRIITLDLDRRRWQALARSDEIAPGIQILMIMAVPHDEVLAGADEILEKTAWIVLLGLALTLPVIWWISRRMTDSLRRLAESATAATTFHFSGDGPRSMVREVDALARALRRMRTTIQRFLDISARLVTERDYDRLLEHIVTEAITGTNSGGGAVYLLQESRCLRPMAWRLTADRAPPPPAKVLLKEVPIFATAIARRSSSQFVLSPGDPRAGLEWLGAWFPGQPVQSLLVPLRNRAGDTLGLLLLARGAEEQPYDRDRVAFIDALSGTMAITIEKQKLLAGRKALLDGVIRMIAGAIDARSPYTSAHCKRVPELVAMLADAAATHPTSPYRHPPMRDNEVEALHLAAWLHDCGKLFVPDFVADKSVKLETMYNRIHEIRTRFEVLKRDAEIDYWRRLADGGDAELLRRELEEAWRGLDADFAFVAACNQGQPALGEDDIARLVSIGARTWLRTLDDRIGISELERQRKSNVPPRELPSREHLLADRLEHLVGDHPDIERTAQDRMPRPRHRLNLGELYCLSVGSGTLTPEERYLINGHILGTISMLSSLPFPDELASVPDTAGSHHEHLDGSGYPDGKSAEHLSLSARIIAIADVFEALTANDRPYKPAHTTEEALAIMADMARRRHLDPELFGLFVGAGIPGRYAAAHASPPDTGAGGA
jgi:HD-GYP domain-containing protein (c-di-GMP phosphodiesterase class II)/HAMP domain-containing protein